MAYTSKSKINLGKYTPGSGWKDFDEALTLTMGKSMAFMEFNARRWAKQTLEELKKNVPVDTGNLRDSIEIEDERTKAYRPEKGRSWLICSQNPCVQLCAFCREKCKRH